LLIYGSRFRVEQTFEPQNPEPGTVTNKKGQTNELVRPLLYRIFDGNKIGIMIRINKDLPQACDFDTHDGPFKSCLGTGDVHPFLGAVCGKSLFSTLHCLLGTLRIDVFHFFG